MGIRFDSGCGSKRNENGNGRLKQRDHARRLRRVAHLPQSDDTDNPTDVRETRTTMLTSWFNTPNASTTNNGNAADHADAPRSRPILSTDDVGRGDADETGLHAERTPSTPSMSLDGTTTDNGEDDPEAPLHALLRASLLRREREDARFREEEREYKRHEEMRFDAAVAWRMQDVAQRLLDNRRREIDEKNEQLKSIISVAALIAGFEVVVMVDLNLPDQPPEWLVALYACSAAMTVCLMSFSYVLCSLVLVGSIKRFERLDESEGSSILSRLINAATDQKSTNWAALAAAVEAEKDRFSTFWDNTCEDDWSRAFRAFSAGIPLFVGNLITVAYLRFVPFAISNAIVFAICAITILVMLSAHVKWGTYLSRRRRRYHHHQHEQQQQPWSPANANANANLSFNIPPSATSASSTSRRQGDAATENPMPPV